MYSYLRTTKRKYGVKFQWIKSSRTRNNLYLFYVTKERGVLTLFILQDDGFIFEIKHSCLETHQNRKSLNAKIEWNKKFLNCDFTVDVIENLDKFNLREIEGFQILDISAFIFSICFSWPSIFCKKYLRLITLFLL